MISSIFEGVVRSLFRHRPTKHDSDPAAGYFVECAGCGHWTDVRQFSGDCCECCGRPFSGDESAQSGVRPPGWEDAE